MPNYAKMHYPNDAKGITDGKPTHVVDRNKSYGDFGKDNVVGERAKRSNLDNFDPKYWEMPKPSKLIYS